MASVLIWSTKRQLPVRLIQYICDPAKTSYSSGALPAQEHRFVTCVNCTPRDAAVQFMETKRFWSCVSGIDKTKGILALIVIQSFGKGEVSAETAHEIGVKMARNLWGDAHEAVVATHCDTGCVHNHFIVNNISLRDGKKQSLLKEYIRMIRRESDILCRQYGLAAFNDPHTVIRRRSYPEALAEREGKPTLRGLICLDIDRAVRASVTEEEFCRSLEEMGYELRLSPSDSAPFGKPGLRVPGGKYFIPFSTLAIRGYTVEEILARVSRNYRREDPFPREEIRKARALREKSQPKIPPDSLRSLYIHYCFELGILLRHPMSAKRVSFFMKEDLCRMEQLDEQTRFLSGSGIETLEDLRACRDETALRIGSLKEQQALMRRESDRARYKSDSQNLSRVRESLHDIAVQLRKLRKAIRLCGEIEKRSAAMERELSAFRHAREEYEKEVLGVDERIRGRSGRADRENDARQRDSRAASRGERSEAPGGPDVRGAQE